MDAPVMLLMRVQVMDRVPPLLGWIPANRCELERLSDDPRPAQTLEVSDDAALAVRMTGELEDEFALPDKVAGLLVPDRSFDDDVFAA